MTAPLFSPAVATSPAATAAAAKTMATNSRPLPEEHRREEPVLRLADPIADDADEPEECDPGERHEAERAQDRVPSRAVRKPRPGVVRVRRECSVDEHEREDEQRRERDPRQRGGSRGPDRPAYEGRGLGVKRRQLEADSPGPLLRPG